MGPNMGLSYDDISEILKIIDSSSCDEVVLETGDVRLVVRRRGANSVQGPAASALAPQSAPIAAAAVAPRPPSTADESLANGQLALRAPMVGTFYHAPAPNAPPFVEVGSRVEKGDPVCIIEVMKLFTTIYAESGGTITEIRVENATPVEYGQVLFVIDES
jgi:acetyl-CoA carboxylase biotin carboxyl carrier protein